MIEDLQRSVGAEPGEAPARLPQERRRRLGLASLWLLAVAFVLQVVSLVQQLSYLFSPRPGEYPAVVAVVVLASLLGCAAVVTGIVAVATGRGRGPGIFGAALGIAFLVLFAAATSFGWGFLEALSAPA